MELIAGVASAESPVDLVITVCGPAAEEACPMLHGVKKVVHWPFDDPAKSEEAAEFRRVRDEIRARVGAELEKELGLLDSIPQTE